MNPREMERYNPFASEQPKAVSSSDLDKSYASQRAQLLGHLHQAQLEAEAEGRAGESPTTSKSCYSTSFPDPFGLDDDRFAPSSSNTRQSKPPPSAQGSNRSNSVTFLNKIGDRDDDQNQASSTTLGRAGSQRGTRQASGFTSFLSRATSVTSSSVTDRVSGAVGSVRNAVDSLSSQIQQAVPSPSGLIPTGSASNQDQQQAAQQQSGDQLDGKLSAAGYFASRLSSATNQFVGSPSSSLTNSVNSANNQLDGSQTATICRQRVVLILSDLTKDSDWAQQFNLYRRLISGTANQSSSLAFTSFFTSQFSSGAGGGSSQSDGGASAGGDLIEQVDFKDISVLANQSSSTAAVYVGGTSALALSSGQSSQPFTSTLPINRLALNLVNATVNSTSSGQHQQQQQQMLFQNQAQLQQLQLQQLDGPLAKTIRPEYVVVRQRGREHPSHLKSIVKALDYCCVPMFEPYEVWNVFQDRQLIFAKLLRVQRQLSKELFPLIPQVFCQTHKDLLNYIQNSSISLPCLVRTGPLGKGKIRVDNLQMLKDFATIMATSEQSCTIEQYLEVKCDLVVQKLGTSLKLFKGKCAGKGAGGTSIGANSSSLATDWDTSQQDSSIGRQSASRQMSLGSGVLSSLISVGTSSQLLRNNSNPSSAQANQSNFEKMSDVNVRYRRWVEAISKEFDNKIEVFCIKIVVAANDREYIVGMRNCSMEFLGNSENQEEDRRSFVELIISKMNTVLPKHQPVSREASNSSCAIGSEQNGSLCESDQQSKTTRLVGSDKRAHLLSQANVGSGPRFGAQSQDQSSGSSQMLNNRNRSVSMNQGEPPLRPLNQSEWNQSPIRQLPGGLIGLGSTKSSGHNMTRRASDRSDSMLTNSAEFSLSGQIESPPGGTNARQMSIGQSIFDQTSTALSSFQRQSMSFLRRLDTRAGAELSTGGTPPLSAKSETFFERGYAGPDLSNGGVSDDQQKSQSIDTSPELASRASGLPPPKPPPPPPTALMNRQSSLAGYGQHRLGPGQQRGRSESTSANTPITPQNSINQQSSFSETSTTSGSTCQQQRQPQRVIRQNSALSAFEPFDPSLRGEGSQGPEQSGEKEPAPGQSSEFQAGRQSLVGKFDTVSMLSANSNTSDETNTAEDTMNNLKKTFASIFGDKCD